MYRPIVNNMKIVIVSLNNKIELENLIGNVEMKTKSAHFFVKQIPKHLKKGIIVYVEVINVGGAMNLSFEQWNLHFPYCPRNLSL